MSLISSIVACPTTSISPSPDASATHDPERRVSIAVLRASRLIEPVAAGSLIRSESGAGVLRVLGMVRLRTAGTQAEEDRVRLVYERVRRAEVPAGVPVLPWPFRAPPRPSAVAAPASVRAPTDPGRLRSTIRRQHHDSRVAELRRVTGLHDGEPLVPAITRETILDRDGSVLRGPLTVKATWIDPDDVSPNRREPKKVGGVKRADPLEGMMKRGRLKREHIEAADVYRLRWELASGARPGYERPEQAERRFGPSTGPSEILCQAMRSWLWVQGQFSHTEQSLLNWVVLCRGTISSWAGEVGCRRDDGSLLLLSVLDRLVEMFKGDVAKRMQQHAVVVAED